MELFLILLLKLLIALIVDCCCVGTTGVGLEIVGLTAKIHKKLINYLKPKYKNLSIESIKHEKQ